MTIDDEIKALAVPKERIKNEADLRKEIANLEGNYERLNIAYDHILATIEKITEDCSTEIELIRGFERRILESNSPHQEQTI